MAIVGNISSEIGDIIRIQTDVPIIGIVSLYSFVDDVLGETGERYFDKSFRYSVDGGLTFTDWFELTTINIQNIVVNRKDQFVIDYRYVRTGVEPTGDLSFNNLTLSGDFQELPYPVYARNLFNLFFDVNDVGVLSWAINVLEKIYNKGILPDYIVRKWDEINPVMFDTDFTVFFNSMTHFFAIIVYYARQFTNVQGNTILLPKFIESIGLFLNNDPTETHLQYLFENYPEEFRKRGTDAIAYLGSVTEPDGELLRLVNYVDPDEFILALLEPHVTGWCLGKSSPMFNYTRHSVNMVKGYEKVNKVVDKSKYPTSPDALILIKHPDYDFMSIQEGAISTKNGIYPIAFDETKAIQVSEKMDYEVVINFSQSSPIEEIYFGCRFFDSNGGDVGGYDMVNKDFSDFFFEGVIMPKQMERYSVRGIIFKESTDPNLSDTENLVLDIGFGTHLKFNPGVSYIMPFFYAYSSVSTTGFFNIHDFKVRPLNFNFTLGRFGLKNILHMVFKNNSIYKDSFIYQNTVNKLIPCNNVLIDRNFDPTYSGSVRSNYGLLYNFYAVSSGKLAPEGWHIPTDTEWTDLFTYLGGVLVSGGKMKETGFFSWLSPNTGATNSARFYGKGGGFRDHTGGFFEQKETGVFWGSNEFSPGYGYSTFMYYDDDMVTLTSFLVNRGATVRCIKDDSNDTGIAVDVDGNLYDTVTIGTQVWMIQNLKVTKYNDGEVIPLVENGTEWAGLTTGGRCAYNNDNSNI